MLKLLLVTLSTWSVVSCCFSGAVGLLLHHRDQRVLQASLLRCGVPRTTEMPPDNVVDSSRVRLG